MSIKTYFLFSLVLQPSHLPQFLLICLLVQTQERRMTKNQVALFIGALLTNNSIYAQQNDIDEVVVEGQYLSSNEVNSVKTPTPIIDVPQSLSIFDADQIKERGITSVGDIIDYTPGVNTSQGEGHRDSVVFRGVRSTADFYIDGNRDDVQYFRGLYNLEQVEILRGPNALLFGRGGTGGVLNRVTKKAEIDQQFTGYKTTLDSFGGFSAEIDTNFITSDTSSIRLNAHYDSLENHRDFFDGDRIGFNPTARFELSEKTTLDLSYEYADHDRFIDRGIPSGDDNRPASELEDITFADPERNFTTLEAHLFRAAVSHKFSDSVKGNFSAFYGDYDKVYSNFFPVGYSEANNTVNLDGYIDETDRQNLIISSNLVAELNTGNIGHTIIVGSEYIDTSSDQFRLNSLFASNGDDVETFSVSRPISFSDGVAILADGTSTTNSFSDLNDSTQSDIQVTSLYIQDQISLSDNFDLLIGARYDRFDIEVVDIEDGGSRLINVDSEVSPRAGLIYKPQENVSIYASYSESFLPRSGEQFADISGSNDLLDPDQFENVEIGAKWDVSDTLSFTAAIFENQQTTPVIDGSDASGATLIIQDAEVSGFEFQVNGQVTESWSFSANYSNLDGELSNGSTPRELPENTFSIWNAFQVNSQIGIGIGATYQDESFTSNGSGDSRVTLPSYTRIDASAYYNVSEKLRIQLNVENLTDTDYFPNAHTDNNISVGAPINAQLSLIGKF